MALLVVLASCGPKTPEQKFRSALRRGDVEAVTRALEEGMSASDPVDGDPPLHIVAGASMSDPELIALLTEKGADLDAKNDHDQTAWDVAWARGAGNITSREALVLIALIEAGFEPADARGEQGEGLLHRAAQRVESARVIDLLIHERGLKVDDRDAFGWTPLHYAARAWNYEATQALLQAKADPNAESTETWQETRRVKSSEQIMFRYEKGSRPLDVLHVKDRSRMDEDVRKPIEEYGGEPNPKVDNRHR